MADYYDILGVKRGASTDDLKKAYKKKAMKHHPDRGGDVQQFQKINEAYDTLKDPQKRTMYDQFGETGGQQGYTRTYTSGDFGGFPHDISDVINDFFGGGHHNPFARRQRMRNKDISIQTTIDLEDVMTGKSLIATYRLSNGKQQSVNLELPAGIESNTTIKFAALGDNSIAGVHRGDLMVRIRVTPHRKWHRDGANLHCVEKVSVFDLLLGTKKEIKTIDKKNLSISIPKGCQPGTVLCINEHGLPKLHGRGRGNIYMTVQAEIPNINDPEILKLLQRIKYGTN